MIYVKGLHWLLYGEQARKAEWKEETQMRDDYNSHQKNHGGLD